MAVIHALGIMVMLMILICYLYPKASSSKSSAQKEEKSSSNSSIQKRFKYDVFLSFRGDDTRKNFIDHLYQALMDKGIYTYKDDEKVQKGERIGDALIKAIEDSKFYIIVFSKNYASSAWCLDELVQIMECHKMTEHTAYPVFYDVEPTEVRNQNGAVRKAFFKNKKEEAVEIWKWALNEAADLAGWELKNTLDGHEAKFIKKIVQEISLELRSIDFGFDEKLIGMETRVKDAVSYLEISIDEVRMIGIKGMGGAGKTTTVRAIFDHLSNDFEAKCFVGNVREVSNASMFGLKNLQEQVLSNVLNEQVTLNSVDDGKDMLKRRMFHKKVLLVLDDVDHIDQLEALAGGPNWFKPGSRIIITTRDEQVLVAHRVNLIRDINLLSDKEAICLFSRYAFGREFPSQGYQELSEKVVSYASGLPLTIKVLGSFICGKDRVEWVDAIERLDKIPLKETMEKLELSYIGLEDDYKEIFLDIACILKGKSKTDAIRILESCGFHARNGLKVLEQRSLITISEDGDLGMHDHIEEMGKNIVRRSYPDEPNKHSRLWIYEEIADILANEMGTEATRCLKLNKSRGNERFVMKGLGKMKKLRYLEVNFAYYDFESNVERPDDTSQYTSLKYLKCLDYPFKYFPTTFQADNLVALEMSGRRMVQLWEEGEKKVLEKLKFLSVSNSDIKIFNFRTTPNLENLSLENSRNLVELCMPVSCQKLNFLCITSSKLRTFDLGLTPNLERLSLEASENLLELCIPVSCQKLTYLDVSHSKLRNFDLGLTPNLETLSLFECADFVELRVPVACPSLKFLNLRGSRVRSLDLELIPNLERLELQDSHELVEINAHVGCLKKVVHLNLGGCLRFTDFLFPDRSELSQVSRSSATYNLGHLECLEELHLSSMKLKHLPDSICTLKHLKSLTVYDGDLLERLPEDLGKLECLEKLHVSSKKIEYLPESICMLKRLKYLEVNNGDFLEKLPEILGRLECLEKLHVSSKKIEYLPDSICMLKRLKWLYVTECHRLGKLPENIVQLESLERLDLSDTRIKHLPDSICMLKHLIYLNLKDCALLEKLPEDLGRLECLEKLHVSSKNIVYLPDSICMLKRLKSLEVNNGDLLEKLPEDLGRLECLEKLHVSSKRIEYLPDSICMLKRLKWLYVTECCRLGKLPEGIVQLESLERLDLSATRIKNLPDSICMLKHLIYLNLEDCALLETLPEDLGRLECLGAIVITDTHITHLPQSMFELKGLFITASPELLQLYDFPSSWRLN